MSVLEVLGCGPGASVQDMGRTGHRRFGVPTAGAMDRAALALANALVGNPPGTAALELPFLAARFRLEASAALVSAVGAGAALAVDGRPVPPATSALVRPGQMVEVGAARSGVYTYLAVAGGLALPPLLGSRSSHLRTGFGPPALAAGDRLPVAPSSSAGGEVVFSGKAAPGDGPLRVIPGPQETHFDAATWAAFLDTDFRISPRSDRMGLRLKGLRLASAMGHDIVSEGVVPGSIQIPGDGQPIVLGRDCQTTGGYPKIATVISADLGRLAQMPPGAALRFRTVTPETALDAARRMAAWQDGLTGALRPADWAPTDLMRHNLISGVTTPRDH